MPTACYKSFASLQLPDHQIFHNCGKTFEVDERSFVFLKQEVIWLKGLLKV